MLGFHSSLKTSLTMPCQGNSRTLALGAMFISAMFIGIMFIVAFAMTSALLSAGGSDLWAADSGSSQGPSFESKIAPLLIRRCVECHNEVKSSGELVLSTRAGLLAGGESGPVVIAGKPAESYLLERVTDGEMPPEVRGKAQPLSQEEVELLREWIKAGMKWPTGRKLDIYEVTTEQRGGRDWWSFQSVQRPAVPTDVDLQKAANPIDCFILKKLRDQSMTMAPPADRAVIVRRLYFDLQGFPPTPAERDAFLADSSPDAYERLVDRLLASPHYGERWGRYWLDLVRFAETCGYERDQIKPAAWKYRDWVIHSLNSDLPYDRFVVEQLAGDEVPNASEQTVIATGFLRVGTWNDEPNDAQEYKYVRLDDMVHTTATAFLALTLKCARCHDHKFDPIPQVDYYGLANAFWAGTIEPGPRALLGGPSPSQLGYQGVFGWTDRSRSPPPLRLLKAGDPKHPRQVVKPAHLSLLPALNQEYQPPPATARTTGRRLQLARWIVDPHNPLTARVMVNRLWQHHFGKALVRTPNNFGFKGQRPTHPQLLDYLAAELVAGQWHTKRIHRLLLTSQVYRQSSLHPQQKAYRQRDSGNQFWWRAQRRRLDAEALRDSMLATSGQLNRTMAGPSFVPVISPEALEGWSRKSGGWTPSPQAQRYRRAVYMFTKRGLLTPLMTAFDFCDTTQPVGKRDVTTVAPQALALLNNEFVHARSEALARRVIRREGDDPNARVRLAWQFALGRDPTKSELTAARSHLLSQRQHFTAAGRPAESPQQTDLTVFASLCHVLINTNEFIYVD